jgi:hypothetical protein
MKIVCNFAAMLAICLLLSGCGSWMDGSYSSVTPHRTNGQTSEQEFPAVKNISQLKDVLADLVERGVETGRFSVEEFHSSAIDSSMEMAIGEILSKHSVAAYALEDIDYEIGTTGGVSAVAVTLTYNRSAEEIRAIRKVSNMEQAQKRVTDALCGFEAGVVLRIGQYQQLDFSQIVDRFSQENPDLVMENPQVTVSVYPQEGIDRVVDVRFSYQTDRDALRTMRAYVEPVFSSAALYVSSEEETDGVKYARLCTFLMERNDYQQKTSLTPAYSLLRHGVGDSRAFAMVYAAMCRKAGLDCKLVSGTRQGEPWFWNMICEDGVYYHVDVYTFPGFAKHTDAQMAGYVWDYSAYPACGTTAE